MDAREALEQRVKDAHARGDYAAGATLAVDAYGRELLSFLITRLGEQAGYEAFSSLLEDFWRGFPAFGWRSSLRTWAYTLARHAAVHYLRDPQRRYAPQATPAEFSLLVERVRSETAAYLKTEVKDRFGELRAQLPDDDQMLLILRVDRRLSWEDIAQVMSGPGAAPNDRELATASAKHRTQFQRAKKRLRTLAEAEGLVPASDDER
jgi:RNA polymerase sigma-70 factor, ECF subfamily